MNVYNQPTIPDECVSFLRRQAATLGLPIQVYHMVEGKPIVVITWRGSEPALPAILLNSHMDVFPTSNFEQIVGHGLNITLLFQLGQRQY
uniref:Aminoacylase-1 n=1 Tax=Timema genevievae TaxID=629358 RepID=A0A7R9JUP0_TIMGE|nr:unnamed protein product [Timema genevievae]